MGYRKMSKSMFNVVNPDMIVERYGADTLRLYEMFLGPLEQSKPWDTNGIDGCHRFLKKFWGLFFDNRDSDQLAINNEPATKEQLKSVHKLIKKITADIENFSFNTAVSAFMICVTSYLSLSATTKNCSSKLLYCSIHSHLISVKSFGAYSDTPIAYAMQHGHR